MQFGPGGPFSHLAAFRDLTRVGAVSATGVGNSMLVLYGPIAQGIQGLPERTPERCEPVVDSWRDHRRDDAVDQTILLQLPQDTRQGFLGDVANLAFQFGKPLRSLVQKPDKEDRPLAADSREKVPDRTACRVFGQLVRYTQRNPRSLKVPSCMVRMIA